MNLGSPCKQLYDVPGIGKLPLWLCCHRSAACANAVDSCLRNTNLSILGPWSGYLLGCSGYLHRPLESSALKEIIWGFLLWMEEDSNSNLLQWQAVR